MRFAVGERFDRYLIEELLGSGGMGEVYRAQDEKLRRRVALKIVRADAGAVGSTPSSDGSARLLREARAAAALDHPNAVAIFDVGEQGECAFIAMELVEGRSLRAYVGDDSVPTPERVRWLVDAARALAAAHKRGLVHRDVKPENVMVRDDGAVKVLDFGIARRVQAAAEASPSAATAEADTITREGLVLGTPAYMAPEQLRNEPLDGRADQFAWGVMAYELLRGDSPWKAQGSGVQMVAAILTHEAPPLAEVAPGVPPEVSAAVARAMAKRAVDRFATMDDLLRALGATTGSAPRPPADARSNPPATATPDPISATRPSAPKPEKRPAAPSRAAPIVAAIVAAGAIAALVLATRPRTSPSAPATASASASSSAAASPSPVPANLVQRRLTSTAVENSIHAFAVNHDGTEYAYVDAEGAWLASVAGSTRRRIALSIDAGNHARPAALDFFPDGKRLLALMATDERTSTWIVPLDGSEPTATPHAFAERLSPDGTRVLSWREGGIDVADLAGGPKKQVAPVGEAEAVTAAWSPSGTELAILRAPMAGNRGRLEIVAADGTWSRAVLDNRRLLNTAAPSPTWTAPDRVAFPETINDAEVAIVEVQLNASHEAVGEPRVLWREPLTLVASLAYRGGRFFYVRADSQRDVYVGRVSADLARIEGAFSRLTTSDASDTLAGFLPDGRVLYTSMRDGRARIYAQAIGARVPEALSPEGVEAIAVGAIAGGEIVAIRRAGDAADLVAIRPPGEIRTILPLGAIDFVTGQGRAQLCARCTTKGPARCVISADDGSQAQLSMIDPIRGERGAPFYRTYVRGMLDHCALSDDGSKLFIPDKSDVLGIDTKTGNVRKIVGVADATIQFAAPMPRAGQYFVSGMGLFDKPYGLGRLDESGHASPLWTSDNLWIYSPMLAPNGRDLAAVVRVFDTDIWMLEPNDRK